MKKLQLSLLLMMATVLMLAAFEGYWLHKLYKDEYAGLRKEVDVSFRETMNKLQLTRFEKDTALITQTVLLPPPGTKATRSFIQNIQQDTPKRPRPGNIVYKTISGPDMLKNIPPDSIQSISVFKSGFSFKGAPNPALIELIMKQAKGQMDSAKRFVFTVDSTFKESLGGTVNQFSKGLTISIRTKDSTPPLFLKDSLKKAMVQMGEHPMIRAAESIHNSRMKTDSIGSVTIVRPQANIMLTQNVSNTQGAGSPIIRFLSNNKTINDSIPVKQVDSAYRVELGKSNKKLKFSISFESFKDSIPGKWHFKRDSSDAVITDKVFVGYNTPYAYQARFEGTGKYVLGKMQMQIGGSVLLLLLVAGSFVILYRNLLAQQRLAEIKNDFISNITHELKTPIATVGVAIEALRNFNAIQSPERTKEYLDISAAELQRLSLLVDKVLKLSMFEKQQIELNKEPFDLKELIEENLRIMKLQFDKHKAKVTFTAADNSYMIEADKLHMTSVIYNLLDNALKYSSNKPEIQVVMQMPDTERIQLQISDNGIGIAPQHQSKIFEKFFRVPTGNKHNIKGYGLGLSYVAQVIKSHKGSIRVESEPDKGSTFIVELPVRDQ
ncbi:sensor histidine kinase [Sediminibacterium goheungense]|uniref:histidine kinase n=1 Tax=Sediminibacterium goheungense TaxID=1086393 RepID=A0A4V3C4N0_9BACT|nr:HAMP domain-containing sensor histidine kinase [Sediminibacterium goheungense]TDO26488.1 phospho-acceptor domain-containing protein [Sediminibacterium goheungense]